MNEEKPKLKMEIDYERVLETQAAYPDEGMSSILERTKKKYKDFHQANYYTQRKRLGLSPKQHSKESSLAKYVNEAQAIKPDDVYQKDLSKILYEKVVAYQGDFHTNGYVYLLIGKPEQLKEFLQ